MNNDLILFASYKKLHSNTCEHAFQTVGFLIGYYNLSTGDEILNLEIKQENNGVQIYYRSWALSGSLGYLK